MPAMTVAERQRRYRAKVAAEGGASITVALTAKAADNLAAWVATGETATSVINRLLSRSRQRRL